MKNAIFLLLGIGALNPASLLAVPNPPHLAWGVVQSVDQDKRVLVIVPADKDGPTTFTIKEDRTRLRQDGKPANLVQLSVGQIVRVYYKKELGEWIATEVFWKTAPPPRPHVESEPRAQGVDRPE